MVKLTREDADEVAPGFPARHSFSDGGSLGEAEGVTPDRAFADTGEGERDREDIIAKKLQKHQDPVIGIDIQATPPGKTQGAQSALRRRARAHLNRAHQRHHGREPKPVRVARRGRCGTG